MIETIKKILPRKIKELYHKRKQLLLKNRVERLPLLSEESIANILSNELGIAKGNVVFVHSSLGSLNFSFPSYRVLDILLDQIGEDGTLLFPTYPKENSYTFLKDGLVFNIKKTPTYTGLLNEYARRHTKARRSLHPTKSVVAIGKHAEELTAGHNLSIYPYSQESPYFKINKFNTKIIGIGVDTTFLSAVHSVEDTLLEKFPVDPYHSQIFNALCIDYSGNEIIVKTKAHDMSKMHFNLPIFFQKNINANICKDINLKGMQFFLANSAPLYSELCNLAQQGTTIYSKRFYKGKP